MFLEMGRHWSRPNMRRLDRKSSRGMIYENEELRLRTININAEVERGQTDIKRLRKENEQLRREIWTLRDECDRLNKRVKAKFIEHEQGIYSVRCSGGNSCSCQYNDGGDCSEDVQSRCNSEGSDSCDSCCCQEENITSCNEECCVESKQLTNTAQVDGPSAVDTKNESVVASPTDDVTTPGDKLTNFDHLSVVSEETLSNSEVVSAQQTENLFRYTPDTNSSQATLPSLLRPLTPLTPVELVANELHDLQAVVPPLSYFENILQHHMSTNYGSTPESSSTTNSGKTIVKHTNGWDYKLESPFVQRKHPENTISPIMTKRLPAQTLTTFVPITTASTSHSSGIPASNEKPTLPKKPTDLTINSQQYPIIETDPNKTLPSSDCGQKRTSANYNGDNNGNTTPKHFFSPIKPKLKLNTALANQKRLEVRIPQANDALSQVQSLVPQHICEPPDIYVTNALATPYRPPNKAVVKPPPIPQRITNTSTTQAQVSSKEHQRNRQQQPYNRGRQHQTRHYQHHQPNNVFVTNNDLYVMPVICATTASITATTSKTITTVVLSCTNNLCTSMKTNLETFCPLLKTMTTTVLTPNALCNSLKPLLTTQTTIANMSSSSAAATFSVGYLTSTKCPPACFKFINSNINFRKPNDPVYAIAQNVCHNLITASAVTQPLMSSIVKCCIAKQQQLQQHQHATAASSFAADDASAGDITIAPLPSTQQTESPPSLSILKLSSASCSLTINSSLEKPITTELTIPNTAVNSVVVDSMCQTDSANLESILNDIEAISEDILAIQLVKNKSRDNINNKSTDSINKPEEQPLRQDNKNKKPYRSEMNLLLTYDGDNPTIKQAETTATSDNTIIPESMSNIINTRRTKSLERDHTDSPSPHIPDPMQPFPENRKYVGLDRINKAAVNATATTPIATATDTQTAAIINSPLSQRPQLPLSPLVTNVNTAKSLNIKQLPPTPPTRSYPTHLNIKCTGVARSSSVTGCVPVTETSTQSSVLIGVPPNKSQLYAAFANAAAKRAQFRSQPTHMTRSLDVKTPDDINGEIKNNKHDEKEPLERIKGKCRRVSIICADTDSLGSVENISAATNTQIGFELTTTGRCTGLNEILPNPSLHNFKQTSQSTPNSPHSSRKHENSPTATTPIPPTISITPNSTPQHQRNNSNTSGMSQLLAHNHAHSNSYPNVISPLTQQQKMRKNSQDVIKSSAAEIACAAANVMRSKCSRRHSDSTVSHANQRISSVSGGTNGTHHHHLHNHYHRQHSTSLASNTNHHQSHHSRRDSNQETVASFSDRNSNSLTSSRESSASLSMRSQRRKLSVSSHTGGKIPWCGCWGNGCL